MSADKKVTKKFEDMTFIEKVIAFVKGGDEANVKSILKIAAKKWRKQIVLKTRAIKDLNEKLIETLEEQDEYKADELAAYREAFLNIDVEIKGRDNVVDYVNHEYEQQIANAKSALDAREETISDLKTSVEKAVKQLNKEIKTYEAFLKEIA